MKTWFRFGIPLGSEDLAKVGLKVVSDDSWSLTFGKDTVTRKSVSEVEVNKILARSDISWDLRYTEGVITAIYVVTGGLTFSGDANAVAIATLKKSNVSLKGTEAVPDREAQSVKKQHVGVKETEADTDCDSEVVKKPNDSVEVTPGWNYTWANQSGKIVLAEDDPAEWVIAIEYHKVEYNKYRHLVCPWVKQQQRDLGLSCGRQ